MIDLKRRQGASAPDACTNTLHQLKGIEIDAGLATLSQLLLRRMLKREYGFVRKGALGVVKNGDALSISSKRTFDLIIGNPPYGKVRDRLEEEILNASGRASMGGHTNLYSLFLLRGLNWVKPGGGLVFVLPTSFVAGPYFAGLRHEVFSRAFVKRIDLLEQRENLFLGAVQDICLLVLRRREEGDDRIAETSHPYELGYIDADGVRTQRGTGLARSEGEPWTLPVAHEVCVFASRTAAPRDSEGKSFTLSDYGYRVRVGKVVPTREPAIMLPTAPRMKAVGILALPTFRNTSAAMRQTKLAAAVKQPPARMKAFECFFVLASRRGGRLLIFTPPRVPEPP